MADRLDLPESLRQPPSKEALCQATRGLVSSGRAVDERGTEVAAQSGQGLRMDANILFFFASTKGGYQASPGIVLCSYRSLPIRIQISKMEL
jgi:hypothetical protein